MDIATIFWLIAGIGFLVTAAYLVGAGTDPDALGILSARSKQDWPRGVQEMDVPRFAVEHLDGLRPATGVSTPRDLRHPRHSADPA